MVGVAIAAAVPSAEKQKPRSVEECDQVQYANPLATIHLPESDMDATRVICVRTIYKFSF
eukprot:2878504-Amphidinium_carterae.1